MVARIHDTFYDAKATILTEADIKEIRESRGKIPSAPRKMAKKFHIGLKRVYEIWDNKERLQQGLDQLALDKNSQTDKTEQTLESVSEVSSIPLPATEIPKKNGRKKKVKIDEKLVTGASSMVEKNNKNGAVSSSDNSSDTFREDRVESLLKNLVNRGEKLKGLTANTTPLI
ncbi:9886_t:CDS:1 [Funneliformis geosporum]|uniref:9886_t:CDS:1 n=1 Tax=Funneliformis geosporum TaxID=1117311 RepID=A0A9W4WZ79_9GLOM|nr:9886_t:CDS:1 [Funneliformis geosporum]